MNRFIGRRRLFAALSVVVSMSVTASVASAAGDSPSVKPAGTESEALAPEGVTSKPDVVLADAGIAPEGVIDTSNGREVAYHSLNLAAGTAQLVRDGVEVLVGGDDQVIGIVGGEPCQLQPNAGRRTGDNSEIAAGDLLKVSGRP